MLTEEPESFLAVPRVVHRVAGGAKRFDQVRTQLRIIFGHKDAHGQRRVPARPGSVRGLLIGLEGKMSARRLEKTNLQIRKV
jgi:hypothetical protein